MARALAFFAGVVLTAGSLSAAAQALPDPTRPPSAMMANVAGLGDEPAAPAGPVLQSVMLREGAKPRALISGEWVELGQKYGEGRLVAVNAERVVLNGPQGRETLKLTPDVDKRAVTTKRSAVPTQGKTK